MKKLNKSWLLYFPFMLCLFLCLEVEGQNGPFKNIEETSPSKSMYFDWININWYGGNEQKVLRNLEFFKWLHDDYGMELDIYLLDAGNFDNGPNCNGCEEPLKDAPTYAGLESEWFKSKYPNGLDPLYKLANSFGCKLGAWIGPDGYGDTESSAQVRMNMLTRLVKDYEIDLFKLDLCASDLDPDNEKYFIQAMQECYAINPDLIVLNHRITLSDSAKKYTTTFLWEGAETYIDVSSRNSRTAPHHRYTLERGLPPDLKRLTEDHGVCLSSYLDFWEDELILQAFNRSLILSPEIYGNPWLLRDDEYPILARIFNLQRQYNEILTNARELPQYQYGPYAVSRGDAHMRFITLRNLSWEPVKYMIQMDTSIGLENTKTVELRQYHPYEIIHGEYNFGETAEIEVLPFRTALLKVSSSPREFGLGGSAYIVTKDVPNHPVEIDLLGMPGEQKTIDLFDGKRNFKEAILEGEKISLENSKTLNVKFGGDALKEDYHQNLGYLSETSIPADANIFNDVMYFATDNNNLEARSLERSGKTEFEAVQNARDAFFKDDVYVNIGAWDKFAFDGDSQTFFKVRKYCYSTNNFLKPGLLRIDLKEEKQIDKIIMSDVEPEYVPKEALVSTDLKKWHKVGINRNGNDLELIPDSKDSFRYIKLSPAPWQVSEVKAYYSGNSLDVSKARASNLFPENNVNEAKKAWKGQIRINEITISSYLAVAIEGDYGQDGAFAVISINDQLIGAYDRSPGFVANHWEHHLAEQNGNYTYYFKLTPEMVNQDVDVFVIGTKEVQNIERPQVWITAYPIPFEKKKLILR
ncbi:hypothetical protein [Aquiflexum sp.]|uniref:hypothetical protein n=1 Tax=Aquiflexum sp. TaxID=1872584 RepID=UPI0035946D7C